LFVSQIVCNIIQSRVCSSPQMKNRSPIPKSKSLQRAPRAGNAAGRKELKKSALTRQRILDAAASIFALKGYGRTLMGEIAESAGIHITALYYHFNTKDDLAEGVINHIAFVNHRDIVHCMKALPPEATFFEKLRTAIRTQLEGIVTHREYILAQSKVLTELPDARQERHRAIWRKSAAFWRQLLQEGKKAGAIRADLDPSIVRMTLQGSINWTIEWYRPGGRSAREIADQFADTMLNGIAVRPGDRTRS
jgi:TetR/AcrR family transcriptional regulator, cholesterol catabolism regulator